MNTNRHPYFAPQEMHLQKIHGLMQCKELEYLLLICSTTDPNYEDVLSLTNPFMIYSYLSVFAS